MGNTGPADAAVEALYRYHAAELGPRGSAWPASTPPPCTGRSTRENIKATSGQHLDPDMVYEMISQRADARPPRRSWTRSPRRRPSSPPTAPARSPRASSTRPAASSRDDVFVPTEVRVRRTRRAPPPRAARPLLPDARLLRGGRGPRAGDAAARVAPPRRPRARRLVPRVAVPDRHQRVPRRDQGAAAAGCRRRARRARCRGCSRTPTGCSRPSSRSELRRRPRDDRARVPGHDPAAAAAPARRADPARRARAGRPGRGRPRCSSSASRRSTARCSARARRCAAAPGATAARNGSRREVDRRPSGSCSRASSTSHERGDVEQPLELLREDIRVTMPPHPMLFEGRNAIGGLMRQATDMGEWRLVPIERQPPAGRGELPAGRRATTSSAPSSSTSCAWPAA